MKAAKKPWMLAAILAFICGAKCTHTKCCSVAVVAVQK
jgi:hypothetical protein